MILSLMSVTAVAAPVEEDSREEIVKAKELAILKLGHLLSKHGFAEGSYFLFISRDACWQGISH